MLQLPSCSHVSIVLTTMGIWHNIVGAQQISGGTRGLAFLYNALGSVSIAIIEAVVMEAHDFVPTYWIRNKVTKGIILRCPSRCRHILHFLQGSLLWTLGDVVSSFGCIVVAISQRDTHLVAYCAQDLCRCICYPECRSNSKERWPCELCKHILTYSFKTKYWSKVFVSISLSKPIITIILNAYLGEISRSPNMPPLLLIMFGLLEYYWSRLCVS